MCKATKNTKNISSVCEATKNTINQNLQASLQAYNKSNSQDSVISSTPLILPSISLQNLLPENCSNCNCHHQQRDGNDRPHHVQHLGPSAVQAGCSQRPVVKLVVRPIHTVHGCCTTQETDEEEARAVEGAVTTLVETVVRVGQVAPFCLGEMFHRPLGLFGTLCAAALSVWSDCYGNKRVTAYQ